MFVFAVYMIHCMSSTVILKKKMLKRSCPFESHPNQMKTHVGQKEVAQGVNKEKHMKEVYEKTLAMMFASQNESSKGDVNSTVTTPPNATSTGHVRHQCHSQFTELLPGQCLLDEHGKVISRQTTLPKANGNEPTTTPLTQSTILANCYTCQSSLCSNCVRSCQHCNNPFCSMCSLINYDEDIDRIFCLSCSSHMK